MSPWRLGVGRRLPLAKPGAFASSSSSLPSSSRRRCGIGGDWRPASPIRPFSPSRGGYAFWCSAAAPSVAGKVLRQTIKVMVRRRWWIWWSLFEKRYLALLWCGWCLLLLLTPLPGHGGAERGGLSAISFRAGGDRGVQVKSKLIHARGNLASAILCWQGSVITTSDEEALLRICHGSSMFPRHQVVCLRWLGDGQRQRFFAKREPSSNLLSFLRDTQGPNFLVIFSSRVFVIIWKALSSNCWFLRARLARALLQNCTCHFLMKWILQGLLDPYPGLKKLCKNN
jgi:hypothetical protein